MQQIVVINPKGGSGKTTIATNLAACFAASGRSPALMDLDPQGSSTDWLEKRPSRYPPIHGIQGFERSISVTRSWRLRVPPSCESLIVDTPAGLQAASLPEITRGADALLVPVVPSDIDIQATARFVEDLLLIARIPRRANRIGIVATRVRRNTRILESLWRFLNGLDIPVVGALRDTQNCVRTSQTGVGLHEMPRGRVRQDLASWAPLTEWLEYSEG